ncbi:XRE family transcriptional regulator [Streptomyces sp. NPDC058171]
MPLGTGKDGVYRWIAGRTPDGPTQLLIAELLGIAGEAVPRFPWPHWLALDPLQQPPDHPWDASGAIRALEDVPWRDTMEQLHRRHFVQLTGGALTTSLWTWLTADPAAAGQLAHGKRLGAAAVGHIEDRVRRLRRADDEDGGGQVLTETALSLRMTIQLLKDRTYTNAHGARLHAAAADLTRMHAWAAFDLHGTCDDATFQAALQATHAASDPVLGAHVLAFWSIAASSVDRAADAETMTTAALAAARGRTTPRVEAMLLSRRARARAKQHDPLAYTDLDRSADLVDATGQEADPEWVYWFDQAEHLGALASTHLDLGHPDRAERAFTEGAALFPADRVRTQALFLARRADAQWSQGEIDGACSTAGQALDLTETISSHRSVGTLNGLARRMGSHKTLPAVRDFRDRLTAVLPPATSSDGVASSS